MYSVSNRVTGVSASPANLTVDFDEIWVLGRLTAHQYDTFEKQLNV